MPQFPEIVYRIPGQHIGPGGTTYDYLGVADAAEMAAALKAGWHASLTEASGAAAAKEVIETAVAMEEAIDEISPATREELEQKAKELGVSFNARTRDEVLAKRIAEALG